MEQVGCVDSNWRVYRERKYRKGKFLEVTMALMDVIIQCCVGLSVIYGTRAPTRAVATTLSAASMAV